MVNAHNTKKTLSGQPGALAAQGIFSFWKLPGETLAVMLRRFREEQGLGPDEKLTYAGRLDPMAEGIVPVLCGEARFQKDRLLGVSKTYEVDVLLGIGTDTADLLGLVTALDLERPVSKEGIAAAVAQLALVTELAYPQYSSRTVDGVPLFVHARAGRKVLVPIRNVTIHSLSLTEVRQVALREVLAAAMETIHGVQGDFRQAETLTQWQELAERSGGQHVYIVSICATVSSGTYMRALAERLGTALGVPALAMHIVRTAIGENEE